MLLEGEDLSSRAGLLKLQLLFHLRDPQPFNLLLYLFMIILYYYNFNGLINSQRYVAIVLPP